MTGTNCDSLRTSSKTPDEKVVGVSRESARVDVPVVDEWIVWGISAFAVALTFRLPFSLNVCGFYEMPFPAVFGSTPAMEEQIPSFAGNLETHEGLSREDWPEALATMDEDFNLHVKLRSSSWFLGTRASLWKTALRKPADTRVPLRVETQRTSRLWSVHAPEFEAAEESPQWTSYPRSLESTSPASALLT